MKKVLCTIVWLILMISMAVPVAPVQAAKQTWTVVVGGAVKDAAVVSNSFRPRSIEIAAGNTVTWTFQKPWTLHTVTFLSGQQGARRFCTRGR